MNRRVLLRSSDIRFFPSELKNNPLLKATAGVYVFANLWSSDIV